MLGLMGSALTEGKHPVDRSGARSTGPGDQPSYFGYDIRSSARNDKHDRARLGPLAQPQSLISNYDS
jgi:hypothetical protein